MTPREANADLLAEIAALRDRVASLTGEVAKLQGTLAQASEQQTATSEILRMMSSSPTNLQVALDAIATNAARVCGAYDATVLLREGELVRRAAHHGPLTSGRQDLVSINQGFVSNRCIRDGKPVHLLDVLATDGPDFAESRDSARHVGFRTILSVPLLHEGRAIGALNIRRQELRSFSDSQVALLQTFADQAVIAIENVRLFNETKEALERQTATSEILRVIASSPTDLQPVFESIAANAARLCAASDAQVLRVEGNVLRLVSAYGSPSMPPVRALSRGHAVGRAVIDRQTIHIRDMAQAVAEFPETSSPQHGVESLLAVPLLHNNQAVGVIRVSRTYVQPFTEQQVTLLQTFADQAVIAIENVRLFTELQEKNRALTQAHAQVTESLEQQTATSEVLRAISGSLTDVQPVLDIIALNAARVCGARDGAVLLKDEADLCVASHHGPLGFAMHNRQTRIPIGRDWVSGRSVLEKHAIQVEDLLAAGDEYPRGLEMARIDGHRTTLATPLLREGEPIGVLLVRRGEVRLFTPKQMTLLETFAAQAVIAIENVRLFKELQTSNRDLTAALEQQTATGEILGVISSSPTDVQPVFDTIVRSARRLLGGRAVTVRRLVGDELVLAAYSTTTESGDELMRSRSRVLLTEEPALSQVVHGRVPHIVSDTETDPTLGPKSLEQARARGFRSLLVVPLLRENNVIGILGVGRREPGPFTDDQVALLQTFADQAVIAIENVRLFKELEAANRELAAASQHKSEFLANMSHELRTPLNAIIGFSEVLSEKMFGELNEKQEEYSKDIHASGQHLLSLINDILDLSKIEAGRMELELTDFDLPQAIDNALMLVRERAGRRSLTLHKDVDAGVGQVRADERKIRQVVLNLLSNAIKFTPEGGRIEVSALPRNGSVEVSVSDTGVGIGEGDQEAIFEEFRQVGASEKKAEGTGLGLTLCRKFIELHGGKIWVNSELGAGSTFTFTIPVRCAE